MNTAVFGRATDVGKIGPSRLQKIPKMMEAIGGRRVTSQGPGVHKSGPNVPSSPIHAAL